MGSGFRTFTAGEVLTASNVQNYLMDQSVMVFAGSAARSSAIGTANFEEGMVSYLQDTDKVEAYNGTNWVSVAPTSTQGLTLINTTSFSGVTSQSINDVFSTTYKNYRAIVNIDTVNASDDITIRMRVSGADNTSANYKWNRMTIGGAGAYSGTASGVSVLATSFNMGVVSGTYTSFLTLEFYNPFETDNTGITGHASYLNAVNDHGTTYSGGLLSVTTSYTGFTMITASNMSGTVSVYGYNK